LPRKSLIYFYSLQQALQDKNRQLEEQLELLKSSLESRGAGGVLVDVQKFESMQMELEKHKTAVANLQSELQEKQTLLDRYIEVPI